MVQKSEVLTRDGNPISLISTGGTTMQEDYLAITERELPVNMIEQTWTLEVGEETAVGRATPRLVSTLAEIIDWLSHLGSGRIQDRCLESRQHIYHSLTMNRIRF